MTSGNSEPEVVGRALSLGLKPAQSEIRLALYRLEPQI